MGCSSSKDAAANTTAGSSGGGGGGGGNSVGVVTTGTVATEPVRNGNGGLLGRNNSSSRRSKSPASLRLSKSPSSSLDQSYDTLIQSKIRSDQPERLYKLLAKAHQLSFRGGAAGSAATATSQQQRRVLYQKSLEHLHQEPLAAKWKNPTTGTTPLHLACRLVDADTLNTNTTNANTTTTPTTALPADQDQKLFRELVQIMDKLISCHPEALRQVDAAQNIPLHYALAPTTHFNPYGEEQPKVGSTPSTPTTLAGAASHSAHSPRPPSSTMTSPTAATATRMMTKYNWQERAILVERLIEADPIGASNYLERNDVVYESGDATGGCTPLYRALQTLPDDFVPNAPTVEYISLIHTAMPLNAGKGNASDGDKPLSLLYRRFTRQFDISEQFFAGDNSRPQVVQHRNQYKTAAGNTWKLIELLLKPTNLPTPTSPWGIVHCAVQVETPPDLLRYIVETNAQDLTRVDPKGNLPLHYAAASQPPQQQKQQQQQRGPQDRSPSSNTTNHDHFPAFYTKYVMDELLYKFPEAAGMADAQGRYPLTLAVTACSGKQWIGGGIKSLYEAYPDALQQLHLEEHPSLIRALSMADDGGGVNSSVHHDLSLESMDDDDDDDDGNGEDDDETRDYGDVNGDKEDSKADPHPNDRFKKKLRGVVKDEQHDAIMLVQRPNVSVEEVTTSMWAHEEDAGVQMLGCVAISNMLTNKAPVEILRIALTGTASVVNAMKAHPNELIVQEKACKALQGLAVADGQREVSMVASGAVAAIVGAMQAHVGDAGVQQQACLAVAAIVRQGGADRATVVASVSGVTAILNALAAHAQVVGVQRAGLQALVAMTQHPNANLPDLPRTQTEPLLFAAQESFPEECSTMVTELLDRMAT